MGTPFGPKYIPYTYMDPLGKKLYRAWFSGMPGPGDSDLGHEGMDANMELNMFLTLTAV